MNSMATMKSAEDMSSTFVFMNFTINLKALPISFLEILEAPQTSAWENICIINIKINSKKQIIV